MRILHPIRASEILLFTMISVLLALPSDTFALSANRVKNLSFDPQETQEIVTIFLERYAEINAFILHDPERIVVDIKNAMVPEVNISQETKGEVVTRIRIGQNTKTTARVVLDMNKNIPYTFATVQEMVNQKPAVKIVVSLLHHQGTQKNLESESSVTLQEDVTSQKVFEKNPMKNSDFSLSGLLQMRTSLQAEKNDAIENNTSLRKRIMVETQYKNMITVSFLSDYLYFGSEDKTEDYDLDLFEAKWQHTDKKYRISLGKQILRWGKTDQISPVDTLNPQDMREFIIPDYEERKIPVWMADLNLFFDTFTLEGVWIPLFEKTKIDYFGTDWSIFGHAKKELQNTALPLSLKTYFDNINVHEKEPDTEAEFALRLSTTIQNIDLGLTFHHTTEDTPYFKSFPVKNINVKNGSSIQNLELSPGTAILTGEPIEVEYKKTHIAGVELETVLGDLGVRGEAAWQEDESFLTSSLTSTRKPTLFYVVGADHTTMGNIYLNLQFAHKHISNYDPDILYFDQDTYSLLGEIRKDIVSDWLEASLKYSKTLNSNEWYLSPQLKYTYISNLACVLGAGFFAGDSDTWFGRFKDNDLFFLDISYRF